MLSIHTARDKMEYIDIKSMVLKRDKSKLDSSNKAIEHTDDIMDNAIKFANVINSSMYNNKIKRISKEVIELSAKASVFVYSVSLISFVTCITGYKVNKNAIETDEKEYFSDIHSFEQKIKKESKNTMLELHEKIFYDFAKEQVDLLKLTLEKNKKYFDLIKKEL